MNLHFALKPVLTTARPPASRPDVGRTDLCGGTSTFEEWKRTSIWFEVDTIVFRGHPSVLKVAAAARGGKDEHDMASPICCMLTSSLPLDGSVPVMTSALFVAPSYTLRRSYRAAPPYLRTFVGTFSARATRHLENLRIGFCISHVTLPWGGAASLYHRLI